MSLVSGSITSLTREQGNVSSLICVAMLCVAIGIVGAIWFISSCVNIGTLLRGTLGGCTGFLFFLCFYRQFTWRHPWRSSRVYFCGVSIGTSLGATLGCLQGFFYFVCTLVLSGWCCCCLVGVLIRYLCVPLVWYISSSLRRPLFLLFYCCSAPLGMKMNNYTRFINDVWCVSLIFAKLAFAIVIFNASANSHAANVVALVENTLSILKFWGGWLYDISDSLLSCFFCKYSVTPIVLQWWYIRLLSGTLGGRTGFLFFLCFYRHSLGITHEGLPGFIFSCVSIGTSLGATLGLPLHM